MKIILDKINRVFNPKAKRYDVFITFKIIKGELSNYIQFSYWIEENRMYIFDFVETFLKNLNDDLMITLLFLSHIYTSLHKYEVTNEQEKQN